jgi:protein disulfide-isomerase A1
MSIFSKTLVVISLLFAVYVSHGSAAIEVEEGSKVLVLGDDNFEEAKGLYPEMLVEFYAPWCGHCKTLAPEWTKASIALDNEGASIKLGKVDATEEKGLQATFGVKGFPTIKFIKNGKDSEYSGGRTEADIVAWVSKRSGPAFATIASVEDLEKMQEAKDVFVLGVFSSLDSAGAKAFVSITESDDANVYAVTTEDAVKAKLAVTGETVVVLKSFDDLRADLDVSAGFEEAVVEAFIQKASTPLIQEFSDESAKKIFGSAIQKHVLIFTDKASATHAPTLATYKTVAPEFAGQMMFVNVPSTEARVAEFFGITADAMPAMVIADMSAGGGVKKFFYGGAHESAAISTFASSFLSGDLKPTLKSEAVLPADTESGVKVAKGTSFASIVLDNDKDVLVEFYAPWCGHCKKLEPIFDELAEKVKGQTNLVIAKMDMTANEIDVAGVDVKGFPTLFFFPGNTKPTPKSYDGGRDLDSFLKYLTENSHHAFNHEEL